MAEAVIICGVRTPFVRAGEELRDMPAPELGRLAVRELLYRCGTRPSEVDELIAGNVASPVDSANVARVIALRAGIPRDRIAHTVNRNCASGLESVTEAAARIECGAARCIVALGVDSMSNVPLLFRKTFVDKLMALSRAKSAGQKVLSMLRFRPRDIAPLIGIQLGLTDPVTGMLMGETAEKLAREYGIEREEQDAFALRSHQKACAAIEAGRFQAETMDLFPGPGALSVSCDIGPRENQSLDRLRRLKPYFDRRWGSVTVGNSCGITDGAVALLLMDAEYAAARGLQPVGRIRAREYAGCDPSRMGLGPVYATARALQKSGLTMDEIDLIELNEAFAAQVLACQRAFESPPSDCGDGDAVSRLRPIDESRLNVNGGAIAIGHPVGATGGRLILTLLEELKRQDRQFGLATLCVGGGQGGAVIVERMAA